MHLSSFHLILFFFCILHFFCAKSNLKKTNIKVFYSLKRFSNSFLYIIHSYYSNTCVLMKCNDGKSDEQCCVCKGADLIGWECGWSEGFGNTQSNSSHRLLQRNCDSPTCTCVEECVLSKSQVFQSCKSL